MNSEDSESHSAQATIDEARSADESRASDMRGRRIPRKYLFFPGWIMLVIAAAAQFMSAPGQSYSVAAFKRSMRDGLSISETDYSLAYGFATVLSGLSMPFVGRLLDRFGARLLLPAIGLLLGGACIGMSQTQSLGELYLTFSLVRGLGQGALTLTAMWLVGEWFERRRGLATAMSGLGSTFSIMTFPLINRYLINTYDWQTAWGVLGVACWFVILLPSLLLVRNRPEDLGLKPDGFDAEAEPETAPANPLITPLEDSWTVAEVLRNVTFWKLLAVPATSGMVGTGLVFHQVSLLGSRGLGTWSDRCSSRRRHQHVVRHGLADGPCRSSLSDVRRNDLPGDCDHIAARSAGSAAGGRLRGTAGPAWQRAAQHRNGCVDQLLRAGAPGRYPRCGVLRDDPRVSLGTTAAGRVVRPDRFLDHGTSGIPGDTAVGGAACLDGMATCAAFVTIVSTVSCRKPGSTHHRTTGGCDPGQEDSASSVPVYDSFQSYLSMSLDFR